MPEDRARAGHAGRPASRLALAQVRRTLASALPSREVAREDVAAVLALAPVASLPAQHRDREPRQGAPAEDGRSWRAARSSDVTVQIDRVPTGANGGPPAFRAPVAASTARAPPPRAGSGASVQRRQPARCVCSGAEVSGLALALPSASPALAAGLRPSITRHRIAALNIARTQARCLIDRCRLRTRHRSSSCAAPPRRSASPRPSPFLPMAGMMRSRKYRSVQSQLR